MAVKIKVMATPPKNHNAWTNGGAHRISLMEDDVICHVTVIKAAHTRRHRVHISSEFSDWGSLHMPYLLPPEMNSISLILAQDT